MREPSWLETKATTWSCSTSCFTSETASAWLPWSSMTTSFTGCPLIPPWAFTHLAQALMGASPGPTAAKPGVEYDPTLPSTMGEVDGDRLVAAAIVGIAAPADAIPMPRVTSRRTERARPKRVVPTKESPVCSLTRARCRARHPSHGAVQRRWPTSLNGNQLDPNLSMTAGPAHGRRRCSRALVEACGSDGFDLGDVVRQGPSEALEVLALATWVRTSQFAGIERLGGPEQEGEAGSGLAQAREPGRRHVHPGRADPALGNPVLVGHEPGATLEELEAVRGRGRRAVPYPALQVRDGGLQHVVLLGTGVDREIGRPDEGLGRRPEQFGERGRFEGPRVLRGGYQQVGVAVGTPGDLPEPVPVGVGLPGEPAAQGHDIGLALDGEHRDPYVGTDPLAGPPYGRSVRPSWRGSSLGLLGAEPGEPGTAATSAVDEEALVHGIQGIDGVDVGDEERSRLRLARRDKALGAQGGQRRRPVRRAQDPAGLGEDVVGEGVTGMVQRRVALGIGLLEVQPLDEPATVDPRPLRRDPDPGEPLPDQMPVG